MARTKMGALMALHAGLAAMAVVAVEPPARDGLGPRDPANPLAPRPRRTGAVPAPLANAVRTSLAMDYGTQTEAAIEAERLTREKLLGMGARQIGPDEFVLPSAAAAKFLAGEDVPQGTLSGRAQTRNPAPSNAPKKRKFRHNRRG